MKAFTIFPFLDHSPWGKRSDSVSHSVVSDSLEPHGLEPAKLLFHGILQAKIFEWVTNPLSRGSS